MQSLLRPSLCRVLLSPALTFLSYFYSRNILATLWSAWLKSCSCFYSWECLKYGPFYSPNTEPTGRSRVLFISLWELLNSYSFPWQLFHIPGICNILGSPLNLGFTLMALHIVLPGVVCWIEALVHIAWHYGLSFQIFSRILGDSVTLAFCLQNCQMTSRSTTAHAMAIAATGYLDGKEWRNTSQIFLCKLRTLKCSLAKKENLSSELKFYTFEAEIPTKPTETLSYCHGVK